MILHDSFPLIPAWRITRVVSWLVHNLDGWLLSMPNVGRSDIRCRPHEAAAGLGCTAHRAILPAPRNLSHEMRINDPDSPLTCGCFGRRVSLEFLLQTSTGTSVITTNIAQQISTVPLPAPPVVSNSVGICPTMLRATEVILPGSIAARTDVLKRHPEPGWTNPQPLTQLLIPNLIGSVFDV